jgi:Zn-finger nucleic acid-binding protein
MFPDPSQYERRTCPECGFDEMQVDPHDASILFCPACWNAKARLVWLPRFELDIQTVSVESSGKPTSCLPAPPRLEDPPPRPYDPPRAS